MRSGVDFTPQLDRLRLTSSDGRNLRVNVAIGATAARDGEEGLGYLLTQKFDVLLTDLRMPKVDGFELLKQAENLPSSHRPSRIIAISGEYEAGALHGRAAVQFLPKPFNIDTLLDMLGGRPN